MTTAERAELLRLLAALCDMRLTDAEHARLEMLLTANPEARRVYLQYVDVHSRLVMHPGLGKSRKMPPREAWAWAALEEAVGMEGHAAAWNARRRRGWTWQRVATYVGVAAATLAASLLVQITLRQPQPPGYTVLPVSAFAEPPPYLGTLTQTDKARWDGGHAGLTEGMRLLPGPVRLEEGLARLRFDSGVELVVQGPTELRLESIKAVTVVSGRVVFNAQSAGAPFTIHTPSSTLIDIGTEYGVDVKAEGEEVHVFSGEVQREASGAKPGQPPEVLPAGEARLYVADPLKPGKGTRLDPDRFMELRRLPDEAPAPPDPLGGLLAYEGFDYKLQSDFREGRGDGGSGWGDKWEYIRANPKSMNPWTLSVNTGLARPDAQQASVGGSYSYVGDALYRRRLATPLRMDTDAVYYVSFLFRRDGRPLDDLDRSLVGIQFRPDQQKRRGPRGPHDFCKRLGIGVERNNLLFAKLAMGGRRQELPLSYKEPYLLVAKILASESQADQVFVRVYSVEEPVEANETDYWMVQGEPAACSLTLDWLEIEVSSKRRQTLDELRIGSTWSSVTAPYVVAPHPEPQQPAPEQPQP